jgi:uncharacterized protein
MRRRARWFLGAYGLTALGHLLAGFALSSFLPGPFAAAVAGALFVATVLRLRRLWPDRKRSRWVTHLVDEPLFCQWAGGVLALPLFPLAALLGHPSTLSYGAGLALAAWGTWGLRHRVKVRRVEIPIAGLGAELDGYRIAQLSDLHIGSFDPKRTGLGWAAKANALEPDLAVVTGDLVTSGTSYYEDVADVIGALRARDGVLVILGNHDQWDDRRLAAAIEARGARVLKNEWIAVRRNEASLVVAGVDDPYSKQDDLERTLAGRPGGVPTVLLAHYPDFFEQAAGRGVELTLSGHTHGGQIGLPLVGERYNIGGLLGQRRRGLHGSGASLLYVNAGLGTTGPPLRLGIAPEIALLVLRASER